MSSATWYSVKNPALQQQPLDETRYPFHYVARGGRVDLDYYDHEEEARVRQTRGDHRQMALGLLEELELKGEGYLHRSRARCALATYLRDVVAPAFPWVFEYQQLSDALLNARQHGLWGVGDMLGEDNLTLEPTLAVEWTGRVGQVKLCPDDAREESMRASSLYTPRIEKLLSEDGEEVRYAVFTIPNSPLGFLGADLDTIFDRFKRTILYARSDGRQARSLDDRKRVFPYVRGALATVEAPLSARGDWNVHLNVILVCSSRPDYTALRDAWGANVQFQTVPAGAGAAALRELIKYPLKAVSLKSEEHAAQGSRAPPVIEWPAECFHEWWRAHKGFRRTRSWGELYSGNIEKPERGRVEKLSIEWLGRVFLSPSGFRPERPMMDTRHLDERQEWARQAAYDRRQQELVSEPSTQSDLLDQLTYWTAANSAGRELDLILGNKSAAESGKTGADPPLS